MDLTSFRGRRSGLSGGGQIERKKRRGWSSKRKLLICQVTPFPPFSLEQWMFAQLDFFSWILEEKTLGNSLRCMFSLPNFSSERAWVQDGMSTDVCSFFALLAFLSEGGLQKIGGRVRGARKKSERMERFCAFSHAAGKCRRFPNFFAEKNVMGKVFRGKKEEMLFSAPCGFWLYGKTSF